MVPAADTTASPAPTAPPATSTPTEGGMEAGRSSEPTKEETGKGGAERSPTPAKDGSGKKGKEDKGFDELLDDSDEDEDSLVIPTTDTRGLDQAETSGILDGTGHEEVSG